MVPAGSLKHLFKNVVVIYINTKDRNADEIELKAIDAGALDTIFQEETLQIITDPRDLKEIREHFGKESFTIDSAGLIFIPLLPAKIDSHTKIDYERLLEKLDELDDVQEIYDNL